LTIAVDASALVF